MTHGVTGLRRIFLLLAGLCGAAAAALVAAGLVEERAAARFLDGAGRAVGVVTALETSERSAGAVFCPIVRFQPPHGPTVSFVDPACASPAAQRKGDHVPILFDPAAPDRARIDHGEGPWSHAGGPVRGGVILAALALGLTFLTGRMKKKS